MGFTMICGSRADLALYITGRGTDPTQTCCHLQWELCAPHRKGVPSLQPLHILCLQVESVTGCSRKGGKKVLFILTEASRTGNKLKFEEGRFKLDIKGKKSHSSGE